MTNKSLLQQHHEMKNEFARTAFKNRVLAKVNGQPAPCEKGKIYGLELDDTYIIDGELFSFKEGKND